MSDNYENKPEFSQISRITGLPEGWIIRFHKEEGREYFFNTKTERSVWNPPTTTNVKLLKSHLIANPFTIRVKHILLKHKHSRNPYRKITDTKGEKRKVRITLSEDNARKKLTNMRGLIMSKKDIEERYDLFKKFAYDKSDCSSGKHHHGDLGVCKIGDNLPEFEKAACALQPGEISEVVKTASGLHIIWRVK